MQFFCRDVSPLISGTENISMVAELNFKVVVSTNDGKSLQKEVAGDNAESLMRKRIGESVDGSIVGCPGYELEITGGSDKAGFPMRKGIQEPRKRIMIGKSVGFSGLKRGTKKMAHKKQKGLVKRKTVCGESVNIGTVQINMKVTKEGPTSLYETPTVEEPVKKEE